MTTSRKLSEKEVSQALDLTSRFAKVQEKAPSLDDMKHELGDAVQATVDGEGQVNGTIRGKDALFRAWDMQGDYFKAKAEVVQTMQAGIHKVPMVDRHGNVRLVREEMEDFRGRKKGYRRLYVAGRRQRLEDGYKVRGRVPFDFEDEP